MASIGEIYREAQGKPNGYSGRRSDTYAVSGAVGPAATSRGHEGQIVVTVEWHVPESISDDDLSASGFLLGPWRGGLVMHAITGLIGRVKRGPPPRS